MSKTTVRQVLAACFRNLRRAGTVAAAALICSIAAGSANAQTVTGTNAIFTSNFPQIEFKDNVGDPRSWTLLGSDGDFRLQDNTATTTPIVVAPGAPNWSFKIDGDGLVGLGEFFPATNLHGVSEDGPYTFRMQDNFGGQAWDVEGGVQGFFIHDVEGVTTPFSILPAAPTDSLFVADNGNVGMGTDEPNKILAKVVGGRVLNIKSPSGAGQVAVQGAGSYLSMVDSSAAFNKRTFRLRVRSNFAYFEVPKDDLSAYTVPNALVFDMGTGLVGMGILPEAGKALKMKSGAHCTTGGVWTNASSRELKQDIQPITSEQARETMRALQPVGYRYKTEPEEKYVGFIAEDVPELVATNDRKSLAPMDITAVLTKVVQDQDRQLQDQNRQLDEQRQLIKEQQELLTSLNSRMAELEKKTSSTAP